MSILKQNFKMARSGLGRFIVYNFGIVAFRSKTGIKTCPSAKDCVKYCYARRNLYTMGVVKEAKERALRLTQFDGFSELLDSEVKYLERRAIKKKKKLAIRINDGGDFYSRKYLDDWIKTAVSNPNVTFYAYTKEVALIKSVEIPQNFTVIFSYGGIQDALIDPEIDRHSKIFKNANQLRLAGYTDASKDDLKAIGKNKKVGLVEH